jgi:tetratricopeptide (TPR) repeat protein
MPRIASYLGALACLVSLHAAGADAPTDERTSTYRQYRQAFDAGNYEQALPLALRVVELTGNQFGAEEPELANPLTNLATTLYRMRQYGEALDTYRRALTILDLTGNATDPRLIAPLHGLGATLRGLGRDEEAIVPLKRAVDIIRNRDGLHAPAQLPILRALIECFEDTGRLEDAGREHQYAYNVAEQAWGAEDPRMIGEMGALARWFERTRRYTAARLLYMKAVQVADREQPGSLKAIDALRGIARTYRLAYVNGESQETVMNTPNELPQSLGQASLAQMMATPSGEGERSLRNALERLEAAGVAKAAERAAVLIDLGDWYRIAGAGQRALSTWREAWNELTVAGDTSALATPATIVYRAPQIAESQRQESPEEYDVQEVRLRVAVAADGSVRDTTVANPAPARESAERAVTSAVRRAIWRPAFAGGMPVAFTDHAFTERVYVRLPEEDAGEQ